MMLKDYLTKELILNNEIYIDFFDTLVHRDCSPETILHMWAKKMHYEFPQYTPEIFYLSRKQAEEDLRYALNNNSQNDFSYETLMREIYVRLGIDLVDFTCFVEHSFNFEVGIEIDHIYIDEELEKLITAFDIHFYILSDFYLPEIALKSICNHLGIDKYIIKIYVSSDWNLRKSNGTFYEYLNSISSNSKVMIGDNECSDIKNARSNGFYCIKKISKYETELFGKKEVISKLNKIYTNKFYEGYAFELYLFISKLYEELIKMNCKDVFFLSREGQFLKELFEIYSKGKKKINTHYFLASRTSTFLPSLNKVEEEDFLDYFETIKAIGTKETSIYDFLKSLSFEDKEIFDYYENNSTMDKISSLNTSQMFLELINSDWFKNLYEIKRNKSKRNFMNYFDSFNIEAFDLFFVDIGWKGTIQDNIQKIIGTKYNIHGFYYGINNHTRYVNHKKGLVFDRYPNRSRFYNYYNKNDIWLEKVLAANHGTVLSYEIDGTPVLSNAKSSIELFELIKPIQNNVKKVFITLRDIFDYSLYEPKDIYLEYTMFHIKNLLLENNRVIVKAQNINDENWGVFNTKKIQKHESIFIKIRKKGKEMLLFSITKKISQFLIKFKLITIAKISIVPFMVFFYRKHSRED